MDKKVINKEIDALIDALKNDFTLACTANNAGRQQTTALLLKTAQLQQKMAVWEYLQLTTPTVEIKEAPIAPAPATPVATPISEEKTAEIVMPAKPAEEAPAIVSAPPVEQKLVVDIKKYIGFNDRFEYINELFKGNAGNYDAAIAELNKALSKQEAQDKFDALKKTYSWTNDNESAGKLQEIIQTVFK